MLRRTIDDDFLPIYKQGEVTDEAHISNIQQLCDKAKNKYGAILNKGTFRFGTAQKLLNLYLKYLWCLKEIKTPPHFPVDRRIQTEMKMTITNWTSLDTSEAYMAIINAARAKFIPQFKSLALMELELFGRSADED